MKYKVGDKVRIRRDLTEDLYGVLAQYAGLMAEIKAVKEDIGYYTVDADSGKWRWTDDFFENEDADAGDKTIRPDYYKFHGYDVFDIADYFGLSFPLGNALKYILRHKDETKRLEDLKKARQCLDRAIELMEGKDNV